MEVQLLGRKVKISFVSKDILRELSESTPSEDIWGYYDSISSHVYVYSGLKGGPRSRVILHELFHAVLGISGVTNVLNDRVEESVCDTAEALVDIFKDPKFVKLICKND